MNEPFSFQELETLVAHQGKLAVSIYVPTSRIPTRVQAESLQLRSLLRDAESQLQAMELRTPAISAMLEPARELIADSNFWRHQQDGLAVFLSEDSFHRYQLPISFKNMELVVAESYHIKPLLPILTDNADFYILAVSQNSMRLLRANRFAVSELDPATIPASLAEALRPDEGERQIQIHAATTTSGAGKRGALFFGHSGGATDVEKEQLRRYFAKIDRGLREYLQDENPPLVFAGVDYLFPIYREANTYPHLVESSIVGNPEGVQAGVLRQEAWKLIEPIYNNRREASIEEFHSLAAHGQASSNLPELVAWADQGRVLTAFVNKDAAVWGVYNQEKFQATVHGAHSHHNRDLTDLVAIYTLLRKGNVYLLSSEEMEMEFGEHSRHSAHHEPPRKSDSAPAAAGIYRYAI